MQTKLNRLGILRLDKAVLYLLGQDIDTMLSVHAASILTAVEGPKKAGDTAKRKVDEKHTLKGQNGKPVAELDEDGKPTGGFSIDPDLLWDYQEQLERLEAAEYEVQAPTIKLSALRRAQEEDNVPIPGWVLFNLGPFLERDVEGDAEGKKEEPQGDRPNGRAATRRATREAAKKPAGAKK